MPSYFGCDEKDVFATYIMFLSGEDPNKIYEAACRASKNHKERGNLVAFTHAEVIRAYLASHPLQIKESVEILDGIEPEILETVLSEGILARQLIKEAVYRTDRNIDAREIPVIKKMFPEQYFCLCLFSGLLEEAESVLTRVKPEYALVFWLVKDPTGNWEEIKTLMDQNRSIVGASLLLLLLQKGITVEKIEPYIIGLPQNIHFLLLMKHLLITGEDITEYLDEPITSILKFLDDWEVYEYALKTGFDMVMKITPQQNPSEPENNDTVSQIPVNALRYLMEKDPTPENIRAFINCRLTFEVARKHIIGSSGSHGPSESVGFSESNLDKVLQGKPTAFRMWVEHEISGRPLGMCDLKYFIGRESDAVLFIGVLLSDRTFSSVLSALLVSAVIQDSFSGCFLVRLIFLFISRYFMMYKITVETYRKLNIQSVQLEGLTYAWHDLSLFFRCPEPDLEQQYIGARNEILGESKVNIEVAVSNNNYMQLLSLLEVYRCLSESPISKQIEKGKHQRSGTAKEILEILPDTARYIFAKVEDPEHPFLVQTLGDSCITGQPLEEIVTATLTEIGKAVEITPEKKEWVTSTLIPELITVSQVWGGFEG